MKIAVIGSGITGLACGYLLSNSFSVTLYEKEKSIGIGANNFIFETENGQKSVVDIPHRVVSPRYYHNLIRLLSYSGIKFKKEDFSSAFSLRDQSPFFAWTNLKIGNFTFPIFDLLTILKNPILHIRLLFDSLSFYKTIRKDFKEENIGEQSTLDYFNLLKSRGFSSEFIDHIILPFLSIVNTCSFDHVLTIPAKLTMEYLVSNSFSLRNKYRGTFRPIGGVNKIIEHLSSNIKDIRTDCSIKSVYRQNNKWAVKDNKGDTMIYDHVVIATQSNHALKFLKDMDDNIRESLEKIEYTKTKVIMHTDENVMPSNKDLWTPIHIIVDDKMKEAMATLWVNKSQPEIKKTLFQTSNPIIDIDKRKIIVCFKKIFYNHSNRLTLIPIKKKEIVFERPVMNHSALDAMKVISMNNGNNNLWFCGSYSGKGLPLLEAGVTSAIEVSKGIGAQIPKFSDSIIIENRDEKFTNIFTFSKSIKAFLVIASIIYFFMLN